MNNSAIYRSGRAYPEKLFFLLLILIILPSTTIIADEVYSKNKQGNDLYKKGNYDEALKKYDDALLVAPADTLLKMNRGSTLYRLGRVDEADSAYAGALSIKSKHKQADAHYNLGNIQFKEGDLLMQSGGQGAGEKYKSALQNYIAALDLRPGDRDAKWNIELTQRRIKLQEQQQNQKNKDNKNDDIKPSEYAKKMKALADNAVAERKYKDALNIMTEALQKDKTVMAFQDFIKRLKDVNGIKS